MIIFNSLSQIKIPDFNIDLVYHIEQYLITEENVMNHPFEVIKRYRKKDLNWKNISRFQKLSEDFIREFQDRVNWDHIPRYQELSKDFIREFRDRVEWNNISYCQKYFGTSSLELFRKQFLMMKKTEFSN